MFSKLFFSLFSMMIKTDMCSVQNYLSKQCTLYSLYSFKYNNNCEDENKKNKLNHEKF